MLDGAPEADVRATEGDHHEHADRDAERKPGHDVCDKHPPRVRGAEQGIQRGDAGGAQRAGQREDDDLESHWRVFTRSG